MDQDVQICTLGTNLNISSNGVAEMQTQCVAFQGLKRVKYCHMFGLARWHLPACPGTLCVCLIELKRTVQFCYISFISVS